MDVSSISVNQYTPISGNIIVKPLIKNTSPILLPDNEEAIMMLNVISKDWRLLVVTKNEDVELVDVGDIVLHDFNYQAQPLKFREGLHWQVRQEAVLGKIKPYNPTTDQCYEMITSLRDLKDDVYKKTGTYVLFGLVVGQEKTDLFNMLYGLKGDFEVQEEESNKQTGLYIWILPKNVSVDIAKESYKTILADKQPNKHKTPPHSLHHCLVRDYEQLANIVDKLNQLNNGYTI